MGTTQSLKVAPATPAKVENQDSEAVLESKTKSTSQSEPEPTVFNPNAEMIDLRGSTGSTTHPRFQIGVTEFFFPWLSAFVEKEGGESFPSVISTEQLVWGPSCQGPTGASPLKWSIAEQTRDSKCSFIVWCLSKGLTTDDKGRPLFAPVTTFVSHAWKGSFISLRNSIAEHCQSSADSKDKSPVPSQVPAFFLDIFVVNQHTPPWKETPVVGMDYALKQPIELSLKTLLVMSPFEDPVPLKRAWCIYEICNTKRLGASLDITMPAHEHKRFVEALTRGEFDFNDWITNIDIEKAGAYDPSDKEMIMDLVSKSPGSASGLNRTVVMALCEWLSTQGYAALEQIPERDRGSSELIKNLANVIWRQGKPDEAEPLYAEMVKCRRAAFGDVDVRTLDGLHVWGRFQRAAGRWGEARKVLEEAVRGRVAVLGASHEDSLSSNMELAEVYRAQGDLEKADALIREVISGWRVVLQSLEGGHNKSTKQVHFIHVNFYESLKVHAAVLLQKGQGQRSDEEISSILAELFAGRVELFGARNPATLDVTVLQCQHRLATGGGVRNEHVVAMNGALETLRGTLGDTHPRTLNCMCILSQMIKIQVSTDYSQQERIGNGSSDRSMTLITEAVKGYRATLGDEHPDTRMAIALQTCRQEDIQGFVDKYCSCFSPLARVLLADGVTTKYAKNIVVGDNLYTWCGLATTVRARVIQKNDAYNRELVQIGDMLISKMHRVQHKEGSWMRPIDYPGAVAITQPCELHNFIVDGLLPIVVSDVIVSTIGTFCPGMHDLQLPNHALWASRHIVDVFWHHPMWPVVELDSREDNFLEVLKNKEFAREYKRGAPLSPESMRGLLIKHGWKVGGDGKVVADGGSDVWRQGKCGFQELVLLN